MLLCCCPWFGDGTGAVTHGVGAYTVAHVQRSKLLLAALGQLPLPVCNCSEPSHIASEQIPLPVAPETEQEQLFTALEQMSLPVAPEVDQEPPLTSSEQMPLPTTAGMDQDPSLWRQSRCCCRGAGYGTRPVARGIGAHAVTLVQRL